MVNREQITPVGNGLSVLAPAKVNLSLLIAGKRPDGFHEVETVMAKVNWYDEILIQPSRKPGIELICKGPHWAPEGQENLVCQAAKLLVGGDRPEANLKIALTKNVPVGTGLGSASSDAAATLIGLNEHLELELDKESLLKSAAKLGSDVPFFLNGPLALCTGKGEKIRELDQNFAFLALIALPDVSISTKEVYANYKHDPALYKKLSARINDHIQKNRIDLVVKMCANMLAKSCFEREGGLAKLKAEIESLDIGPWCLSGSGSAMLCVIESGDEERAIRYKRKLEEKTGCKSIIVSSNRW